MDEAELEKAAPKPLSAPARLLVGVSGAALVLMMLHILADVLCKYLLNYPLPGTMEIVASFYMVTIAMLPLASVTLRNSHVKVEVFSQLLTPRWSGWLGLWVELVSSAALALAFVAGLEQALRKTRSGEAWETAAGTINIWQSRWIVPVGLGLCALAFGWRLVCAIRSVRRAGRGN